MARQHSDGALYISPGYGSGSKSRTRWNAPGNNSHLERTENTKSEVRMPSNLNLKCSQNIKHGTVSFVWFI